MRNTLNQPNLFWRILTAIHRIAPVLVLSFAALGGSGAVFYLPGAALAAPPAHVVERKAAQAPSIQGTHFDEKKSYVNRFRDYRSRRQLRHSDDYLFNAVRMDLLKGLMFERNRQFDLIDCATRRRVYQQTALPPGIQKQVVRGKPLPPGMATRMINFKPSVMDYLGFPSRKNVRMGVLGDQVLLYNTTDGTVYDLVSRMF